MSTNTILFGALFLLVAIALFLIVRIEIRLKKLFRGSRASSLESLLADMAKAVDIQNDRADTNEEHLKILEARLEKQGHGVKLVRFNPFTEVGGNQSFAVGIVNKEGDGVVFSSLYSRERMSVFAKPITKGVSDIELTPEEKSVVDDAHKSANL
ncbi:MAG: DUF4446 family protein [bacterium]